MNHLTTSAPLSSVALILFLTLPACASQARSEHEARAGQAPELIAAGRQLLDEGQVAAALERFEAAGEVDGPSLEARFWIARAWLADGRLDEGLAATDELKALGAPEADLAYLYGLGFHAAALQAASAGGGVYTQGQFQDATRFLVEATAADPERYGDAFRPLAEAAWYAADLPVASEAAERAVERRPDDTAALVLRGRVAFSRYSAARADGEPDEVVDQRWTETRSALEAAAAAFGEPTEEVPQYELAGVFEQLGNLHQWREDSEQAAVAFGQAMAWDPRALDLNRVREALGNERFAATVQDARALFAQRHPAGEGGQPTHPGVPLLAWWEGFASFELGRMPEAEGAFLQAVEVNPGYANSWYYVFRAAYGRRQYDASLIALRAYWKQDSEGLLAAVAGERELNLRILEFLVGWLIDPDQQVAERFREAAILAEIMTRAVPEEPRYWNNLGLFLRDYGDQLKRKVGAAPGEDELDALYERAMLAYERTLEMVPDHPAYLNDTAVMLHYYLERDLDRAESMYVRAIELADEGLTGKGLSTSDRAWFETARKDAGDNLEKLRRKRERLAAESGS